ncbi:MAG: iron-containing alcohol dehydrogenase, partial [Anaerolineae bacterium]|nr:iron-containing alcohol dehydrogenase [Anaerolineae bacterium]
EGASDPEAREKMHCAASIAGLGFGNAMAALAHALGHSAGAVLGLPHGRAVGLFLPYTIEFTAHGEIPARYDELCRALSLGNTSAESASALAAAVRGLARRIDQPTTLREAGISAQRLAARLPKLVDHALSDGCLVMGRRCPTAEEVEKLFACAAMGRTIDF